jgi:hypothetical protein
LFVRVFQNQNNIFFYFKKFIFNITYHKNSQIYIKKINKKNSKAFLTAKIRKSSIIMETTLCEAIKVLPDIWNWNIIIHSKVVLSAYRLVSSLSKPASSLIQQWHNNWITQSCFQSRQAWICNESKLPLLHLLVTINFKAIYWVR